MQRVGPAVQRIKPVFLMSPISVAQFLPPGEMKFDLLVIDEASQIRPEDALGVIARAEKMVIVGDTKQLPPTNFFNRLLSDDDINENDEDDEDKIISRFQTSAPTAQTFRPARPNRASSKRRDPTNFSSG